ncbi:hypothetical protein [Streptomyces sp. NBC_01465]|uniref:hypothetical protein n=1 Tax=Streptomyces sp. NBC_01465 TaxID=2903878 RepID=UPI002E342026|nr:hypothetical protein [Streptomyces sp. NBC_01465]
MSCGSSRWIRPVSASRPGWRRTSTARTITPISIHTPTTGPAYETGGVSSVTKSKTGIPAAVSSAGTKATMPSSGKSR